MPNTSVPRRVALLIDADNVSLSRLKPILKFSSYYGNLKICRAYGDWKQLPLSCIKGQNLSIKRIQVDRVAKDTSDKELMMDAVEFLSAGDADTFIIVSGDGDFRLLCKRIKEKQRKVIGIGNKGQSSPHLQEACNAFYFLEDLEKTLVSLKGSKQEVQTSMK